MSQLAPYTITHIVDGREPYIADAYEEDARKMRTLLFDSTVHGCMTRLKNTWELRTRGQTLILIRRSGT